MHQNQRGSQSPVKVGIIGAGNVLWAYLQALDRLIPRGYASEGPICSRRTEVWPDLRSRRPAIQLVADPHQVVESDVDVVLVITTPESHSKLARLALDSGKHVIVEKPLASTLAEAESLAELAATRGLHVLAAPFVQLAPTFRVLWGRIRDGEIGHVHSARGLYGNAGSTWASWYHESGVGPLGDLAIYNLKSLTALLGPATEVLAAEATAIKPRWVGGTNVVDPDPDVSHLILHHQSGALSSIVSSHAIQRYRRPGLELYGTEGTANLLGDDWDPRGFEIWRNEAGCWEEYEPIEGTWLWTDGLNEMVMALYGGRAPLGELTHDLHLLEILQAVPQAAREGKAVPLMSRFRPLDLRPEEIGSRSDQHHLHDHTRPADEQ